MIKHLLHAQRSWEQCALGQPTPRCRAPLPRGDSEGLKSPPGRSTPRGGRWVDPLKHLLKPEHRKSSRKVPYYFVLALLMGLWPTSAIASTCPTDVQTLTPQLLADLPSYTNRVRQRSRSIAPNRPQTYMVLAGRAEFDPLPVRGMDESTQQVFFTTLDQRFTAKGASQRQDFYWLFLTQTPQGWYMNTLMSRWGGSTPNQEPDPPREVSNGAVGQAIQTWLTDCRSGTVRSGPLQSNPNYQPSPG